MNCKGIKHSKVNTSDEHIWHSTIGWVSLYDRNDSIFDYDGTQSRFMLTWYGPNEINLTLTFDYNYACVVDIFLDYLVQDVWSEVTRGDV